MIQALTTQRLWRAEPGLPAVARRWVGAGLVIGWIATVTDIQHATTALAPAIVVGASIAYLVLVGLWVRGAPGAVLAGVAAFAWLALFVWIEGRPGEGHGKHLPAIVLLVSSLADLAARPQRALELSCGAVAGVYATAGLAKVFGAGWSWLAPGALSMLVLERSVLAPEPFATLRHAVGMSPVLSSALAVTALVVEIGGLGWLVPRWRVAMAVLGCAMHLGIAMLLGFLYLDWMFVLIGLGIASRRAA